MDSFYERIQVGCSHKLRTSLFERQFLAKEGNQSGHSLAKITSSDRFKLYQIIVKHNLKHLWADTNNNSYVLFALTRRLYQLFWKCDNFLIFFILAKVLFSFPLMYKHTGLTASCSSAYILNSSQHSRTAKNLITYYQKMLSRAEYNYLITLWNSTQYRYFVHFNFLPISNTIKINVDLKS